MDVVGARRRHIPEVHLIITTAREVGACRPLGLDAEPASGSALARNGRSQMQVNGTASSTVASLPNRGGLSLSLLAIFPLTLAHLLALVLCLLGLLLFFKPPPSIANLLLSSVSVDITTGADAKVVHIKGAAGG